MIREDFLEDPDQDKASISPEARRVLEAAGVNISDFLRNWAHYYSALRRQDVTGETTPLDEKERLRTALTRAFDTGGNSLRQKQQ